MFGPCLLAVLSMFCLPKLEGVVRLLGVDNRLLQDGFANGNVAESNRALASIHVNVLRIFNLLQTCVGSLTAHTQRGDFSGEREQREAVCLSRLRCHVVSFVIPSAKTQQCDPLNKNVFFDVC